MERYKPSKTIQEWANTGRLYPCKGLATLINTLKAEGYETLISYDDGEPLEEVNSANARMAVHEADMAFLVIRKDGQVAATVLVIPSNGTDWLSDYTYVPWLDAIIDQLDVGL